MSAHALYNKYWLKNSFSEHCLFPPFPPRYSLAGFLFLFFAILFLFQQIEQVLKSLFSFLMLVFIAGISPVLKMPNQEIDSSKRQEYDDDHMQAYELQIS